MYQLSKLPYLFQDLEPYIDTHTMGLHYHKHHQNYLNNLNKILKTNNYDYQYNINELIYHIDEFPKEDYEDILFNLGGVLNHNLYWKSINNPQERQKPSGKLKQQLEESYGNYENFWKKIKEKALKLKGSGYTFLVVNKNKQLDILNTKNQETPLLYGYLPIFNIDLWEHAYYLNYENEKARYLDNLEKIADFKYANNIFNSIK